MAHFAELDTNNTVLRVIAVNNSELLDENNVEQEANGIAFCHQLLGADRTWVQTSYNNNFRGTYAGIGYTYDEVNDIFVAPEPDPEP